MVEIMRSADPVAEIDRRLARIAQSQNELDARRARLEQLRGAADVIMAMQSFVTGLGSLATLGAGVASAAVARQRRGRKPSANGLNDRQTAALQVMRETGPGRDWRLRELVAEIERRDLLPPSKWLDNQLAKDLPTLIEAGLIERPIKGVYRLPPNSVTAGAGEERESDSDGGSREGPGHAAGSDLFPLVGPAPGVGPGSSV